MTDIDSLAARAKGLLRDGHRAILGITGSPGSGKTTLAKNLVELLKKDPPSGTRGTDWVAHVPMDGFHLADKELKRLGNLDRKGAPDTFDAWGYISLLKRLVNDNEEIIYAPSFERNLEQPIAGSIPIPRETRLVVTEGNYLLVSEEPWNRVRANLIEVWFCELAEKERLRRLIARHQRFGKNLIDATLWATEKDQNNAVLVNATRSDADFIISI